MAAYLGSDNPRPMLPSRCGDSFDVKIMLSILGFVEDNYDRRGDR